jgi:hypothetical protein
MKLLEELVVEAVERLRDLSRERDGLREELDSLRERLDAREPRASSERGEDCAGALEVRHAQALSALKEALAELRGDEIAV